MARSSRSTEGTFQERTREDFLCDFIMNGMESPELAAHLGIDMIDLANCPLIGVKQRIALPMRVDWPSKERLMVPRGRDLFVRWAQSVCSREVCESLAVAYATAALKGFHEHDGRGDEEVDY